MKRTLALILALAMAVLCFAGCAKKVEPAPTAEASASPSAPAEKTKVSIAALNGPTGMGLVQLMEKNDAGEAANDYSIALVGAPDEIVGKLTSGEVDIAAVPTNLAATLYNKTQGKIRIAAINTLGVLYVVQTGEEIKNVSDLEGKKIYASGQGSTPEYALNYILKANGLEGKVEVEYCAEHSEVVAKLASGEASIALLPEPFVTASKAKVENLTTALDVTQLWEDACKKEGKSGVLSMGCVVVRAEFAEQNPDALDAFLAEYKASIEYVNANGEQAAQLIADYGIVASAEIAKQALPACNIVYIDGVTMKDSLANFFEVLLAANPASVGGQIPADDFYYVK